jgi:mannose-6-phosphate isomerase-like protein (cupin superfamily)
MVTTAVHQFVLAIDRPTREWQMFPAFHGPTATLEEMSCHASVLTPGGHSPHPPHAHREEELLIPLQGQVELLIGGGADGTAPRVERLGPDDFVYYPAGQHHTIRNPGSSAVAYLMFKWYAPPSVRADRASTLATTVCHYGEADARAAPIPFHTRPVLEGPTSCLGRLHAHVTTLQPGGGYAPHVDAYDVAIVTLSGTVETLSQTVDPLSVIYYGAGERHGMRNIGTGPARYLVFEFHSPGVDAFGSRPSVHRVLSGKAVRFAKRLARPIWNRLRPR